MADPTHALSFGAAAADYDRFRPSYPADAVRWAIDAAPPARVVDLGAGTGILTRAVLALGHHVVPVEPDVAMRARLAAATPGTTALAGSAEAVPLPDGAADAVVAGQAYHWFDRDRAHPELARLVRPGGTFAALWNLRDDRTAWVGELSGIAEIGDTVDHLVETCTDFGPRFAAREWAEFSHSTVLTPDQLLGMVRTRSHYLTAGAQQRRRVDRAVRTLLDSHPDLAGRDTVVLPYRTLVLRARRC